MKLLVFSDSHNDVQPMLEAVDAQNPDMVFHLGDLQRDAEVLAAACPELPVVGVPGNCDGWTGQPADRLMEVAGFRILMAHGHLWQVKRGYGAAIEAARRARADILLFGHTHQAYCAREGDLWVMNPGAIGRGGIMTYGILGLENQKIICYTVTN